MMIRRSAVMLALVAMIMGLVSGFSSSSAWAASGNPVATYMSPEKIEFVSYSKKWNQKKMKALYAELMKNMHGEELRYLGKVVLSPEEKEDELGVANMGYSWTEDDLSDIEMDEPTEIILYDADNLSTVESLATTLSHEYGHHFTYYWLIKKNISFLATQPRNGRPYGEFKIIRSYSLRIRPTPSIPIIGIPERSWRTTTWPCSVLRRPS